MARTRTRSSRGSPRRRRGDRRALRCVLRFSTYRRHNPSCHWRAMTSPGLCPDHHSPYHGHHSSCPCPCRGRHSLCRGRRNPCHDHDRRNLCCHSPCRGHHSPYPCRGHHSFCRRSLCRDHGHGRHSLCPCLRIHHVWPKEGDKHRLRRHDHLSSEEPSWVQCANSPPDCTFMGSVHAINLKAR